MSEWRVQTVPRLHGYSVEWAEDNLIIISRLNKLYRMAGVNDDPSFIGAVDYSPWKHAVSTLRLGQRLLRSMFYNVLPLDEERLFVTFAKQFGVIEKGVYRPLAGLRQPCRVLRQGVARVKNGCVYWGEYLRNTDRESIAVYRYCPETDHAEIVHTFPQGDVRHVHGIFLDPYAKNDTLWCLTGDLPDECRIMTTENDFETLDVVGQGDETYRATSLLFAEDAVYYATDAEFERNYIFKIERNTGTRVSLAEIDGPCFYAKAVGRDLFFSVVAELCPSQKTNQASLWHVNASEEVERIYGAEKDLIRSDKTYKTAPLASTLFQFGAFHFPSGPVSTRETFLSIVGLKNIDNHVLRLCPA